MIFDGNGSEVYNGAMHRFFISKNLEGRDTLILPDNIKHQVKNVLKLKAGEKVGLFDGSGSDFIFEIEVASSGASRFLEKTPNRREPKIRISLYQSLLKKDNFEWVLQKCTEVGVAEYHPLISARSVKKDFKRERAEKVVMEAAEQSGRALVPRIEKPIPFRLAIQQVKDSGRAAAFTDTGAHEHISSILKYSTMALFVGPEGGWSPEEVNEARNCGLRLVSLGKLTLRAETAALVGAAFLLS